MPKNNSRMCFSLQLSLHRSTLLPAEWEIQISDQKNNTETFTATITTSSTHPASMLTARQFSDCPDFSGLIRAHKEPPGLVKRETRWSKTIIVPDIRLYLPAFADVYVAHNVDDCSLAGRRCFWRSVGEVDLGDFVPCGTITIPGWRERVGLGLYSSLERNLPATVETDVGFSAICCKFQIDWGIVRR